MGTRATPRTGEADAAPAQVRRGVAGPVPTRCPDRVGAAGRFTERPVFDVEALAVRAAETVLEGEFLPDYQVDRYRDLAEALIGRIDQAFQAAAPLRSSPAEACARLR